MRLLADTNVVAIAVRALRAAGHDVDYIGERAIDPGDAAILAEAQTTSRVLLTKDNDISTLVFRDKATHAGVLLIDDLGSAAAETTLLAAAISRWEAQLTAGGFVRAGAWGSKIVADDQG